MGASTSGRGGIDDVAVVFPPEDASLGRVVWKRPFGRVATVDEFAAGLDEYDGLSIDGPVEKCSLGRPHAGEYRRREQYGNRNAAPRVHRGRLVASSFITLRDVANRCGFPPRARTRGMRKRADCALRAAESGGAVAAGAFREGIAVETKGEKPDVVTQADRDAQREAIATIRASFPDDPIVGEEDKERTEVPDSGPAWVVDPIDGTNNFVRGIHYWATSVAATLDGEAVAGASVCPAAGDTYLFDGDDAYRNGERLSVSDRSDPESFTVVPTVWWGFDRREEYARVCRGIVERFGDMRRFGSAQLELGLCAAGAIDAVLTNVRADPWDTMVGAALVEAAGGVVTDIDGNQWRHDSHGLIASNGEAHEKVLAAANESDEAR